MALGGPTLTGLIPRGLVREQRLLLPARAACCCALLKDQVFELDLTSDIRDLNRLECFNGRGIDVRDDVGSSRDQRCCETLHRGWEWDSHARERGGGYRDRDRKKQCAGAPMLVHRIPESSGAGSLSPRVVEPWRKRPRMRRGRQGRR